MLNRYLRRGITYWKDVPQGPPDPILGVAEAFKKDSSSQKVNLGVGAYRDDQGKPWLLPSVQKAEEKIFNSKADHEYLPIEGLHSFISASAKLAYGDTPALAEGRIACVQSLSGTGCLRLGMSFLKRFYNKSDNVLLPKPTWGNHKNIAKDTGLQWKEYTYYNPSNLRLDFEGMMKDIEAAQEGSILILHSCAHNPTGIDLNNEQWGQLAELVEKKQHLPFFDSAYQGFASGDTDKDGYAPRLFAKKGFPILLAQSFAKNFGLYGERVGLLSMVCEDKDEAERVLSQLKILARPMYSNPPLHGARIVSTVLNDQALSKQWQEDVKTMAGRIMEMRAALVGNLSELGSKHDWTHITDQIGMFAYTGLNQEQCKKITQDHHVYLTMDGRISIAGLNNSNVKYVAEAIHKVTS